MMLLAEATVKTTGVNWESVTTIAASVIIIVGAITGWFTRQITHAINDLSTNLTAKLETKDVVNGINLRLTSLETTVRDTAVKDRTP
jgi:hypothetical protein